MRRALSPRQFAEVIGVSESSVRRWADDGRLTTVRTSGGHRKIPIESAVRYVRETQTPVLHPQRLGLPTLNRDAQATSERDAEFLLAALVEGRASDVTDTLFSLYLSGSSVAELCDGPIREAFVRIGNLWPHDDRAIFLEHRATTLCIRGLNQLRLAMPENNAYAPDALGCAPAEDPYMLPTLMASLVIHEAGFNETNLGPNTPLDVLVDAVEDERPDLVWLSLTSPIRSRQQSREILRVADVADANGIRLVVGGAAASSLPESKIEVVPSMRELYSRLDRSRTM